MSRKRYGKIELSQSQTEQKSRGTKRSKTHELSLVDLTLDDDDDIEDEKVFKKPKLEKITRKSIQDSVTPRCSKDLAVHTKKVEELKGWFNECVRLKKTRPNSMLLLTGPCGSAKLQTVKVVAHELGYEVFEYTAPIDYDTDADTEFVSKATQILHLQKFLRSTSRFGSIFAEAPQRKLLVLKDFPNVLIDTPKLFEDVLAEYELSGKSPIIFITNDTKGRQTNLNYHLFPDQTLMKYRIGQITFNPIANTAMRKVLKAVIAEMSSDVYKHPSVDSVDSIILSSQGDLRNAILNLLFSCQKGQRKMQTEVRQIKSSKASITDKKFKNLGADESLTLMHALGKIFNPKYESDGPLMRLTNNPEALADLFITQANTFVKMVFTNYASRFTKIDEIKETAEMLSQADLLMNEYNSDLIYYGLAMSIRSAMVENTAVVKGWQSVKGFKNLFQACAARNTEKHSVRSRATICDYNSYMKIIEGGLEMDIDGFEDELCYRFE